MTTLPDDDPAPVAPVWPGDDACCGNGCEPCVFDFFYEEQERYRAALRSWKARHPSQDGTAPPESPW